MNVKKLGRKLKYGEPTVLIRVPESMVSAVQELIKTREVLEASWDNKKIGPEAQKIVDAIAELMVSPQIGLMLALTAEGGLNGVKMSAADALKFNQDINDTRAFYKGQTSTILLNLLLDDGVGNE